MVRDRVSSRRELRERESWQDSNQEQNEGGGKRDRASSRTELRIRAKGLEGRG